MASPVVFIIYIGVIISLFVWRDKRLKALYAWSVVSLVLLLGIFLRFTSFLPYHERLIQRFAHLGWSVWFIAINLQLVKLVKMPGKKLMLISTEIGS